MLVFDIVFNGIGGINPAVGTKNVVDDALKKFDFADFIPVDEVVYDDRFIQIIQICLLRLG